MVVIDRRTAPLDDVGRRRPAPVHPRPRPPDVSGSASPGGRLHYGVLGGGVLGLAAAYELTKRGHAVTVLEAGDRPGGLAASFEIEPGIWLEKFYHHLFRTDRSIQALIAQLGLADRLHWHRPESSIEIDGAVHRFDSPGALIGLRCLPLVDRLRLGAVLAILKLVRTSRPFDGVTARTWLTRFAGRRAYAAIWEPLLTGKFGARAGDVTMAWLWARVHDRTPELGYVDGGFQTFYRELARQIEERGGEIVTSFRVATVETRGSCLDVVSADGDLRSFDRVLSTLAPHITMAISDAVPGGGTADLPPALSAHCLILALDRPLTGTYWIAITDRSCPFLAVVEHTAMADRAAYGGRHLVYLGNYVPVTDPIIKETPEETLARFAPAIRRLNPDFDPGWVTGLWSFAAPFAQPVIEPGYRRRLPPFWTSNPRLFAASMFQVYPHDRGQNYSVELARRVVDFMESQPASVAAG